MIGPSNLLGKAASPTVSSEQSTHNKYCGGSLGHLLTLVCNKSKEAEFMASKVRVAAILDMALIHIPRSVAFQVTSSFDNAPRRKLA